MILFSLFFLAAEERIIRRRLFENELRVELKCLKWIRFEQKANYRVSFLLRYFYPLRRYAYTGHLSRTLYLLNYIYVRVVYVKPDT